MAPRGTKGSKVLPESDATRTPTEQKMKEDYPHKGDATKGGEEHATDLENNVPLLHGWPLFFQQTRALLYKNFLLAWRNKPSTILQLFSSFFFILLIFALRQAQLAAFSATTMQRDIPSPTEYPIKSIPSCKTGFFLREDCYDFVWTGNQSAVVRSLVANMTANNPGRPIDMATQTLGLKDADALDKWLWNNPLRTPIAVIFARNSNGVLSYGIQVDASSPKQQRDYYQDPTYKFQIPVQVAAERELTRYLAQKWDIDWSPTYAEFAHPTLIQLPNQLIPVFLFAAALFNLVVQMGNIVSEKELRLRQAMATMGLMDSVYWLTWTVWELCISVLTCVFLICFGMMFQLEIFLKNSFIVLFCMFFFFWMAMTSFGFFISAFLNKASSTSSVGFLIFIVGSCVQLLVTFRDPYGAFNGFPYDPDWPYIYQLIMSLFPPTLLAQGMNYLDAASFFATSNGIHPEHLGVCPPRSPDCVITMGDIFGWLVGLWAIYLILAIYFDKVLPDCNGKREPWLFFLDPQFWAPGSKCLCSCACSCALIKSENTDEFLDDDAYSSASTPRSNASKATSARSTVKGAVEGQGEVDPDVMSEERTVRDGVADERAGGKGNEAALSVRGVTKQFMQSKAGGGGCFGCFKKNKNKTVLKAVQGPWFEVYKDTLLCLLGPNGAGKSTTINCLTGIIEATGGDARIYGESIRNPASMTAIRRKIGVCPQFDLLWDALSGREHLAIYAMIKGLPAKRIKDEVTALLAEVRLTEARNMRSGYYSGGMRRRLSVAVSLIGNPSIVFLDEPTTGMDPVARRYVWSIIERSKKGRAMVLTTHSMEEADILGDRIAIMAKGRLRCIGTSIHLKQRFGAGVIVTVGVGQPNEDSPKGDELDVPEPTSSIEEKEDTGSEIPKGKKGDGSIPPEIAKRIIKRFFKERLAIRAKEESRTYVRFCIPRNKTVKVLPAPVEDGVQPLPVKDGEQGLANFFRELSWRQSVMGIASLQLSMTTLEDVFLKIARMAELETAVAEGRYATVALPSGIVIKVPVGAERVRLPASIFPEATGPGFWLIRIEWEQDDNGNLCMKRFTDPVPEGGWKGDATPSCASVREHLSCGSTPTLLSYNVRHGQHQLVATPVQNKQ